MSFARAGDISPAADRQTAIRYWAVSSLSIVLNQLTQCIAFLSRKIDQRRPHSAAVKSANAKPGLDDRDRVTPPAGPQLREWYVESVKESIDILRIGTKCPIEAHREPRHEIVHRRGIA